MLHFLCTACERRDRQSMAATPTAAFPALATQIPSAHLFTQAQFAQSTHTRSGKRNKCTLSCEHTATHNCICNSRVTYVNQINIYCSLCMVENLMNIRQAHQACAMNTNKDIIYTEERNKITRFKHNYTYYLQTAANVDI